jgi:hypothetical protein
MLASAVRNPRLEISRIISVNVCQGVMIPDICKISSKKKKRDPIRWLLSMLSHPPPLMV